MAEQILYGLAQQIIINIGSSAFQEIQSMYGVKDDLKKFKDSLSTVKAVLLDADEDKQKKNHAVEDWIRRLQEILYDADDLLDDLATNDLRRVAFKGSMSRKFCDFFSSSNQIWFRLEMSHKIKALTERLNKVKNDAQILKLVSKEVMVSLRETDSRVRKLGIVGREEDKEKLIESLLCVGSQGNVPEVVAIVGLGGLGKTTLAQLVYNDESIDQYFELKMWVCVSEVFELKMLIKKILRCVSTGAEENLDLEQLQIRLGEHLGRKRYLLVLDDVWNEDWEKWDNLRNYLLDGAPGSKILVTTRSLRVASIMGVRSLYDLPGLEENQAWDLFQMVAYREGTSVVNPKLIEIGKEIVKKCQGVPLVIRTLGSLMQLKTRENEWLSVLNNDLWRSCESSGNFIPVLKLSYDHLPTHLKQCFVYCAMFPKDFEFEKEMLVHLWMAQGYIVASSSNECLEEIGEQYFNELLFRSFIQFSENEYGKHCYKMHDLIHSLAQFIARDSCIVIEENNIDKVSKRVRHLYYNCEVEDIRHYSLLKDTIRTLFVIFSFDDGKKLRKITSNCQRLRALCWFGYSSKVPSSIGKLKHLRYLNISDSAAEALPNSIANLHNLQTLILTDCVWLLELPKQIGSLISLRYLLIRGRCVCLRGMPTGLGKLTWLQRLSRFRVGSSRDGLGTLNELEHLNQLRGRLTIEGLENVGSVKSESKKVKLTQKEHLQSVKLDWTMKGFLSSERSELNWLTDEESELLLENLQPHPNLQEVHVKRYSGVRFSSWLSRITNLVVIRLKYCFLLEQIPPLDQLPSLKTLHLFGLYALEYISEEESDGNSSSISALPSSAFFFPSLQEIKIFDCPNLKGWWRRSRNMSQLELRQFPCLSRLQLEDCCALTSLPEGICEVNSLNLLTIHRCPELSRRYKRGIGVDWPNISHIPNIIIDGIIQQI